ncbi:hypothetical protein QE152_g10338 [Popillia japonica]|uniref:Uncharacterized protein n=1 Tax=Popillia japonica TaxID=7064 RepID=A0AAW1LUX0_POPJA
MIQHTTWGSGPKLGVYLPLIGLVSFQSRLVSQIHGFGMEVGVYHPEALCGNPRLWNGSRGVPPRGVVWQSKRVRPVLATCVNCKSNHPPNHKNKRTKTHPGNTCPEGRAPWDANLSNWDGYVFTRSQQSQPPRSYTPLPPASTAPKQQARTPVKNLVTTRLRTREERPQEHSRTRELGKTAGTQHRKYLSRKERALGRQPLYPGRLRVDLVSTVPTTPQLFSGCGVSNPPSAASKHQARTPVKAHNHMPPQLFSGCGVSNPPSAASKHQARTPVKAHNHMPLVQLPNIKLGLQLKLITICVPEHETAGTRHRKYLSRKERALGRQPL